MTTSTLTQPTASHFSLRGIIASALVLLAALTVVLVLVLTHGTSAAGGNGPASRSSTGSHGHDTSHCRPTTVAHYC